MNEHPYHKVVVDEPKHVYAVARNPVEHVVSMYFHCKESKDHAGPSKMPSLDEWIEHHVERVETGTEQHKTRSHDLSFNCYDPINIQSFYLGFNSTMTEEELYKMFDVIGIMDHMGKSQCAIYIRYSGYVPPSCVCNDTSAESQSEFDHLGVHNRTRGFDHGVVHHGAGFNLTEVQRNNIMKLTSLDQMLYAKVRKVFVRQVKEIEEELGIILCN